MNSKVTDSTAVADSLRIGKPLAVRPSIRQQVAKFQADLEAKHPGAASMGDVALATNAYLLVLRHLRRRIAHRKEGKFESAHSLQAGKQLAEALARLRGPEPAKPAPLSPRQQFEADLERLTNRDDSTTSQLPCPTANAQADARETTPTFPDKAA